MKIKSDLILHFLYIQVSSTQSDECYKKGSSKSALSDPLAFG